MLDVYHVCYCFRQTFFILFFSGIFFLSGSYQLAQDHPEVSGVQGCSEMRRQITQIFFT